MRLILYQTRADRGFFSDEIDKMYLKESKDDLILFLVDSV